MGREQFLGKCISQGLSGLLPFTRSKQCEQFGELEGEGEGVRAVKTSTPKIGGANIENWICFFA